MNTFQLTLVIGLTATLSLGVGFAIGVLYERWQRQTELKKVRKDFDKLMTLLTKQVQKTLEVLKTANQPTGKRPTPSQKAHLKNALEKLNSEAEHWIASNAAEETSNTGDHPSRNLSADQAPKSNTQPHLILILNQAERLSTRHTPEQLQQFLSTYQDLLTKLIPGLVPSTDSSETHLVLSTESSSQNWADVAVTLRQKLRDLRHYDAQSGEEILVTASCLIIPAPDSPYTANSSTYQRLKKQLEQKGRNQVGLCIEDQLESPD